MQDKPLVQVRQGCQRRSSKELHRVYETRSMQFTYLLSGPVNALSCRASLTLVQGCAVLHFEPLMLWHVFKPSSSLRQGAAFC